MCSVDGYVGQFGTLRKAPENIGCHRAVSGPCAGFEPHTVLESFGEPPHSMFAVILKTRTFWEIPDLFSASCIYVTPAASERQT